MSNPHDHSRHSGNYNIGDVNETSLPTAELALVQSQQLDVNVEEFPEGPYGAATNASKLGKVSDWRPGQQVVGSHRDANPVFSDRKVSRQEPAFDAPKGSLEGQN